MNYSDDPSILYAYILTYCNAEKVRLSQHNRLEDVFMTSLGFHSK